MIFLINFTIITNSESVLSSLSIASNVRRYIFLKPISNTKTRTMVTFIFSSIQCIDIMFFSNIWNKFFFRLFKKAVQRFDTTRTNGIHRCCFIITTSNIMHAGYILKKSANNNCVAKKKRKESAKKPFTKYPHLSQKLTFERMWCFFFYSNIFCDFFPPWDFSTQSQKQ